MTSKTTENVVKCKYYNLEEIQTIKILNKKSPHSLFHINISKMMNNYYIKIKNRTLD